MTKRTLEAFKKRLWDSFDMSDFEKASVVLDMKIVGNREKKRLYISQLEQQLSILERFGKTDS